jgi:hypothetical protein
MSIFTYRTVHSRFQGRLDTHLCPRPHSKHGKNIERGEVIYLCGTQARFTGKEVKIVALRKIWAGEDITISYDKNAFGKYNCDCLCETSKPQFHAAKQAPHYLRSMRGEIPLDKSILTLMELRHKELYGREWPMTE